MKEHAEIEPIVQKYREYKKAKESFEEAKEMMNDPVIFLFSLSIYITSFYLYLVQIIYSSIFLYCKFNFSNISLSLFVQVSIII